MTKSPLFMHFAVVLFASLLFSCTSDTEPTPPPLESSSSSSSAQLPSSSSVVSSSSAVSSSSLMPSSSSVGVSSSSGGGVSGTSTFKDDRDNKIYKLVKIGTQTWMAENLNYNASGSKCGNGSSLTNANTTTCDTYGRLYDWSTAMDIDAKYNSQLYGGSDVKHKGVCPTGWHIPNNAEWDRLMRYVDGSTGTSSPYDSYTAGRYLKATDGWNSCGPSGSGKSYLCEDTHGFSALPGGLGISGGYFGNVGDFGYWWSASEYYSDYAYYRYMYYYYERAYYNYYSKLYLFSVRCLQD